MSDERSASYLRDLGDLLKRAALSARAQQDDPSDTHDRAFERGRVTAYYEVVSLMQQQAVVFGVGLDELALDDIDPERDLL